MKPIKLKNNNNPKILIRAANWIGDAIMTTPVIRALKKNYPDSHVSILAKPWVVPVFDNNPYIDKIILFDDKKTHKKGFGFLRLAKDLRKYKFDISILMPNSFSSALITFFAGIPQRVGFNTDTRTLLLNKCVKLNPQLKQGHLINYYLGILKGVNLKTYGQDLDLFMTINEKKNAQKILKNHQINIKKPIIGINPGATGITSKRWFPKRYAETAEKLAKIYNVKIIIFGSSKEKELGDYIAEKSGNVCVNLAGKTNLRQAFSLIEKCCLFITNDSGLMHAAAGFNINQIALIGPTNHIATAPLSSNTHLIQVPVMCSPCKKLICPIDHKCMTKITSNMVIEKARIILEK
ncbi:MAG: lipopolysaccharide heptosyltransferase II [Desulfobacteraceae bacterium 4572_130]|nr:MAG: lipopolysaccharide heptosyltransferase II [Desulfobacteraceae bacterium 4572_130]